MPQKAHFKFLAAGKPWFKQGYRYVYYRHYTSFSGKFKVKVHKSSSLQPLTQSLTSQSKQGGAVQKGFKWTQHSVRIAINISLCCSNSNLLSLLVSKACCNTRFATSFAALVLHFQSKQQVGPHKNGKITTHFR